MAKFKRAEKIHEIAKEFFTKCIIQDQSLLWNSADLWTQDNLEELWKLIYENPIEGTEFNFFEKLERQMAGSDPVLYQLLAEILFVYSLPSVRITANTKQGWIEWAIEKGKLTEPDISKYSYLDCGVIGTGLKYNRKHEQISLIIKAPIETKKTDRNITHIQFRKILDYSNELVKKVAITASDMRHALLYMIFPENYEDSINTRDKQKIVDSFKNVLTEVPSDVDDALYQIREVLSDRYNSGDIPFSFYGDLVHEWKTSDPEEHLTVLPDLKEKTSDIRIDNNLSKILAILMHSKNLILHGPPGTGKTFTAKRIANALVADQIQKKVSSSTIFQGIVEDLSFYEVIAFALYNRALLPELSANDIKNHDFLQTRFRIRPVKNTREVIWGAMQTHTDPNNENVNVSRYSEPYLFIKHENSKWSLSVEGKQYLENNYKDILSALFDNENETVSQVDQFVYWTTFHQNYSYEDFIEGIRPKTSEDDPSILTYGVEYGLFRQICAIAKADEENNYILVIDEINRGNIAKIFGELITLLEDDKRAGEPNELSVRMPYSSDVFSVPNNLYVIGTMNTADRSIALIDVALRRRFTFVEIMPEIELLVNENITIEGASVNLGTLLDTLNLCIRRDIDKNHQIGHSYFLPVIYAKDADKVDVLEYVWNNQVMPLLEEYYFNQLDKLADMIPTFVDESIESDSFDSIYLTHQYGDDLIFALQEIVS